MITNYHNHGNMCNILANLFNFAGSLTPNSFVCPISISPIGMRSGCSLYAVTGLTGNQIPRLTTIYAKWNPDIPRCQGTGGICSF